MFEFHYISKKINKYNYKKINFLVIIKENRNYYYIIKILYTSENFFKGYIVIYISLLLFITLIIICDIY